MASQLKAPWRQARVLVTGATGLLGSHLTRKLVEDGAFTVALVRDWVPQSLFFSEENDWRLDRKVILVRGEVEDFRCLERTLNEYEIDTVFHVAAQPLVGQANASPLPTFKANIEGTWNLLEACRLHQKRIQRIVVASSDKAYGNLEGKAYDETFPLRGEHPYDVSKSCTDLLSRSFFVSYGLPVAITRCGNFYGPGDLNFSRIIPGTIRDVLQNKRPVVRSDGKFIRDYIYVEDAAHAYLTLAEKMIESDFKSATLGEAFNFSYGLRLNVLEVVDSVTRLLGRSDLKPEILGIASNEIPVQCLDSAKAQRILGWKPKFGYEEGLRNTVEWYKANATKLRIL